ncbi:MAG TPA: carbamoyltransferase [Syntrophorhabdaceae bacterium]|nr:carbamoyltransferase [Syntrophorhabdaceae bacterium]
MYILGISAYYHDSAAAILKDDEILSAAQEERFTRKKHDPSFPSNAVRFCLSNEGIAVDELDAVVFYEKPLLKFERLLETYYAFAPKGFQSSSSAIPVWIKEKLMLKKLILDELSSIGSFDKNKLKLLFPEHHLSHAGSAFYPSPFNESAILTIDGVGEWATASICHGNGNKIKIIKELKFPHSVGLLYTAFTYYLGFKVNSGEYKLMGLAPYGDPESDRVEKYIEIIKKELVDITDDGSIWLNQDYFDYATGLKMVNEDKWKNLFGFPVRKPEGELLAEHCDLALAIQKVTEETVLKMAAEAKRLTGSSNICFAGGVALNCVANGKILRQGIFDGMWIQPAAGDAGGALGAAYCAYHIYFNKPRTADGKTDKMKGSYLGPQFSDLDIQLTEKRYKGVSTYYENVDDLCNKVAELLDEGKVVGWFQGRMEWGPRALGNRSIIADARKPDIQKKLNLKIKFREGFRPFAPSVLIEDVGEYFDFNKASPYMLLIADVRSDRRKPLPDGYHSLPWRDKLYYLRSDLPAITHIDYSARLQTVHKDTNPIYWQLIDTFKAKTGYGVIVNTSFNVRGEPIVCTPEDAYRCFMRTEMDYLVMGRFIFDKSNQPEWPEKVDAKDLHGID